MCRWQVKLCDPIVTHGLYVDCRRLRDKGLTIKRYINSSVNLTYFTQFNLNAKFMWRFKSKQSLGAAVLSNTSASSVNSRTTRESVQNHVDGEVRCSTDVV